MKKILKFIAVIAVLIGAIVLTTQFSPVGGLSLMAVTALVGVKETYAKSDSISQIQKCLTESVARCLVVHIPIGSLSASDQKRVFVAPCKCYLRDAWLVTETADPVDGTNYWAFNLVNVTDTEDLISADVTNFTGGTAIDADTPYALTPDQNNQLDAGDVIELDVVIAASATTLAEVSVELVISFDDGDEA